MQSILSKHNHSFEFSIAKSFMKIFKTKSPLVVKDCQDAFGFASISQQTFGTHRFLRRYALIENVVCGALAMFANEHLRRLSVLTDV
jgi:hypothetical protein